MTRSYNIINPLSNEPETRKEETDDNKGISLCCLTYLLCCIPFMACCI